MSDVSNMDRVGVILEGVTPRSFLFKVEKGETVPLHEYVVTEVIKLVEGKHTSLQVLAEVVNIQEKDPLATESLVGSIPAYGYELARGEIVGYIQEGRIFRPKSAPKPNTPVYRADDQILTRFFSGDEARLPIEVGGLLNRPQVKISAHLQDLQFHLGIFAQTRAGKSYFAGKVIEEILLRTPFPVVVIDIHGDYVMMDRRRSDDQKHNEYDVVVYYPKMNLRIDGVTAREESLTLSPQDIGYPVLESMLPGLGDRQRKILRDIVSDLGNKDPFGLQDILERVRLKMEDPEVDGQTKARCTGIMDRLELLSREIDLPPTGILIMDFLKPNTLSVICLRGLSAFIQDVYSALIVDMIYKNQVRNAGDLRRAPPVFIFVEEAHRVAAKEGGSRHAVRAISTAIREGAKFGLYLCLISQRPRSIDPNILANIGNYAVLRITNRLDQSTIENASETFTQRFIEDLPSLNQGEVVLTGPFVDVPVQIRTLDRLSKHHGVTPNLKEIKGAIEGLLREVEKERW